VAKRNEDLQWAIDVAQVLQRRHIGAGIGTASDRVDLLVGVLASGPNSWVDVVERWTGKNLSSKHQHDTLMRRVRRIRELLTRASSGLNPDNMQGAVAFQNRTRVGNTLVIAQLLLGAGKRDSCMVSLHSAVDIATRYEQWDQVLRALTMLRRLEAGSGNCRTLEQYDARINRAHAALDCELRADSLVDHARALLIQYTRKRNETVKDLREIISKLEALSKQRGAPSVIRLHHYRVTLWLGSLQGDVDVNLATGTRAIEYLDAHPHLESPAFRAEFEGARLSAMSITGDVERATKIWIELQSRFDVGGANWSTMLQLYFLTCITHRAFDEARDAILLYAAKRVGGSPAWRDHLWSIYRAYMDLLIEAGYVDQGGFAGSRRPYIATLVKRNQSLPDDKAISGAAMEILQVVRWLRAHNYSEVISAIERLRIYSSKYMRNPQTMRTGVFIKMLATLSSADFDPEDASRRAQAVNQRYPEAQQLVRDHAEIVPYDVLWDIVIETLQRNQGSRRR